MLRYDPPAGVNDFSGRPNEEANLQQWSDWIYQRFRSNILLLRQFLQVSDVLFASEIDTPFPASTPNAPIPWNGFPRLIRVQFPDRKTMLGKADELMSDTIGSSDSSLSAAKPVIVQFRPQDEYLEWKAITDTSGKTAKFAFTAEGPEYWEFLAKRDPNRLLDLYGQFTGRTVTWSEVEWHTDVWEKDRNGQAVRAYKKGDYNRWNSVNLNEAPAHLTHPANTLNAEINLAAFATIQRKDALGQLVSERRRLACCSNFGEPVRNSDPNIGLAVNTVVRGGISATLSNPVGLYMQSFDSSRVSGPAGESLTGWWTWARGRDGFGLRAEFAPPAGSPFGLDKVLVKGEPLTRGGQLAELVIMVLYARTANLNISDIPAIPCDHRCCAPRGSDPDNAELRQVDSTGACDPNWGDAYPELTQHTGDHVLSVARTRSSFRNVK